MRENAVVADRQALMARVFPEELQSLDMQRFPRRRQLPAGVDIRIGEIGGKEGIVVAHGRAQQQGPLAVHAQLEMGEIARIAMEQAVGRAHEGKDIAVVIEQGEGIALLQRAKSALLQRRMRRYVVRGSVFGFRRRRSL